MKQTARWSISFAGLGFLIPILVTAAAMIAFGMPEGRSSEAFWLVARVLCPFWSTSSWAAVAMMQITNTALYAAIGWVVGYAFAKSAAHK